jgi:hypothetical protein
MTTASVLKVIPELGVVMGWAICCTENGQPYYDLNVDREGHLQGEAVPENVPEPVMLHAALDFALSTDRPGNVMHAGPDRGTFPFLWPMTAEIADAFGIKTAKTGLLVGYKPPPDVLAKFQSGELRGFSIEGTHSGSMEIES